jgi:ABC-type bacteriocin/lantibiotic exporter with double-glycine peptidase domain
MYSHEGSWEFMKMALVIITAVIFLWWLQTYFGVQWALVAIVLCAGTAFVIIGIVLSHQIQKSTLDNVAKFAAKDAMVDRYRMQTTREIAKGEAYRIKAESQANLIDYKNQQKLLTQKPDDNDTFWQTNETVNLEDWS